MTTTQEPVAAGPQLAELSRGRGRRRAVQLLGALAFAAFVVQGLFVVDARPQDLVTGITGMADIVARSLPPSFATFSDAMSAALETFDIALIGTLAALVLALPFSICAAENLTPARPVYVVARGVIAVCRVVPDLVWALLFVTAVGLGPFAGVLAVSVHSIGMLGRLFAERFEDMDMGPVHALTLTGARRTQVFSHAAVPTVLPSLVGIALYRLDENVRSSLVLGFVGAGGIGFQILTAIQLFDYPTVAMLLLVMFVLVMAVERVSAALRRRIL